MAFAAPSVLVLGAGGILGEAWTSAVLAGLADAAGFDARACDGYVGTSAGSIVAAALVAGVDPRERLGALPEPPPVAETAGEAGGLRRLLEVGLSAGGSAAAPLVALGLRTTEAGGALVRRAALGRVPDGRRSLAPLGRELEAAGARWDGRLTISAVDLDSGRRVLFGRPDAPDAPVGKAVAASCAIPGVFRPVRIGDRRYVDGGVWSLTSLDRAPAGRGTRVLCLNPTGSLRAVGVLSRSMAAMEALALEGRGAHVQVVAPDAASTAALGSNLMDAGPRERVIAAGLAQGRALAGGRGHRAA